jgi:hypothetical protein
VKITLVRHATLLLEIDGRRLLVDPQLDEQRARPPIDNTPNPRRNPLVPLPVPAEEVVRGLDAVVVTHLHRDHLDETGERLLPRHVPVFCQPEDEARLRKLGLQARPVVGGVSWDELTIHRTGGRHGTGAIAERLAPVSGFVLGGLYVAGDHRHLAPPPVIHGGAHHDDHQAQRGERRRDDGVRVQPKRSSSSGAYAASASTWPGHGLGGRAVAPRAGCYTRRHGWSVPAGFAQEVAAMRSTGVLGLCSRPPISA